jgi:hypothetical protein
MEVILPYPDISITSLDIGIKIKDIISLTNKPFSVSFMIDMNMYIPGIINDLIKDCGDANYGTLSYRDDFVIPKITISIEDNSFGEVSSIEFINCVIMNVDSIKLRHESNNISMITVVFDYDECNPIIGILDKKSKVDMLDDNEMSTN